MSTLSRTLGVTALIAMTSATAAVAADTPAGKLVPGAAGVRVTNPPDYVRAGDRLAVTVRFTANSRQLKVRAVRVSLVGTSESETLRPNANGVGTVSGYLHPRSARTYTVRYRIYLGHDKQSGSERVVDYRIHVAAP
jgi:hypothetical protein